MELLAALVGQTIGASLSPIKAGVGVGFAIVIKNPLIGALLAAAVCATEPLLVFALQDGPLFAGQTWGNAAFRMPGAALAGLLWWGLGRLLLVAWLRLRPA